MELRLNLNDANQGMLQCTPSLTNVEASIYKEAGRTPLNLRVNINVSILNGQKLQRVVAFDHCGNCGTRRLGQI